MGGDVAMIDRGEDRFCSVSLRLQLPKLPVSHADNRCLSRLLPHHHFDFAGSYHVGLSCHDIQATQGARKSGVYLIHPPNLAQGPWRVYCDLESEGGGWIVFQVRDDVEPKENFMRGWEDYKVGFGDFDREFWLGEVQGHEVI